VTMWKNIALNRVRRGNTGGQTNIFSVDGVHIIWEVSEHNLNIQIQVRLSDDYVVYLMATQ